MKAVVHFPDPEQAEDEGLVAVGGELTPDFIISAYLQGIFPWFSEEDPILWWSPNPRLVLFPEKFKVSSSLRQLLRSNRFQLKIDTAFSEVIDNCSKVPRPGQDGTWITAEMKTAYIQLHEMGIAHSFETYLNGELVGGLYGLSLGTVFFGESMFFKATDASKFALYHLVEFCKRHQFQFIDAQQPTKHLMSLGAEKMDRKLFLTMLKKALENESLIYKWEV